MYQLIKYDPNQVPWNKGKLVGQKLSLKLQEIWAIRIRLQIDSRYRDLAVGSTLAQLSCSVRLSEECSLKLRLEPENHLLSG